MRIPWLALTALATLAASSAAGSGAARATGPAETRVADGGGQDRYLRPTLRDPQGRSIRLSEFKGKVRVFDIWASWCGPCRMEIPALNQIYERYRGQGLVVVGVSMDDVPADVVNFVREIPIHYPHGMMNPEMAEVLGIGEGQMSIPITLLVDRTGKLRRRFIGLVSPDLLEREIARLL